MDSDDHIVAPFDQPVVLVGAAPVPVAADIEILPREWPVIAVDGGAAAALAAGYTPRILLGDMDSLDPNIEVPKATRQIRMTGQNDTDLEKALTLIAAPLMVGVGFLGGRLDHTLAATHALGRVAHERPILLIGESDILLRLRGDFAIGLPSAMRFSIWPLGQQQFLASTGLRWPLDGRSAINPSDAASGLSMQVGAQIGTSNETTGEPVTITAGVGDGYAVIMPRAALPAILAALADGGSPAL